MNARPDDPSATLYAPACTCVLSRSGNVVTVAELPGGAGITYGYGLIYIKEDKLFYDPLNFLTRGQQLSFLLKNVKSATVERDGLHDCCTLGTCPCYCCPCRGCPDGTVHITMSQSDTIQEEHLYMQMPNSQNFVDRFNQHISGGQADAITSQPFQ